VQSSNYPSQITLPFANNAGIGYINTIPTASQIGVTAGAASYNDGFPPLTMIPKASGGTPPFGQDMNGVLNAITKAMRWNQAGGAYPYNSTFASDSNVSGYPVGAKVLSSTGTNFWLNTVENNTSNPDSGGAGWVSVDAMTIAAITLTSSNVTLTADQAGKEIIILSGVMTTNLNLIFPATVNKWLVVNNCTGAYTVTLKTASGTGTTIYSGGSGSCQIIYSNGVNIYAVAGNYALPWLIAPATSPEHAIRVSQSGHGQCRLSVTSTTVLTLTPYNGRNLIINDTPVSIPTAGVTLSNSGLSASTLYYIYAYVSAGVMTLEASATTHTTSTGGIETKSGDDTRTLVGMIYTNPSSQFVDSSSFKGCLNWFNKRLVNTTNSVVSDTTFTNTSIAELATVPRNTMLAWAGETLECISDGTGVNSGGNTTYFRAYISGTAVGSLSGLTSSTANMSFSSSGVQTVTVDGVYNGQVYGFVTAGTGTLKAASQVKMMTMG